VPKVESERNIVERVIDRDVVRAQKRCHNFNVFTFVESGREALKQVFKLLNSHLDCRLEGFSRLVLLVLEEGLKQAGH